MRHKDGSPTAYTFGKPVVATNVGGLPSMVEHKHTGLLVPPRDERALADAIVYLLQNEALRRQMGANGRRKVKTEYSAENVARQTMEVYRMAIGPVEGTPDIGGSDTVSVGASLR